MFYLLEDNTIIDTKELLNRGIVVDIKESGNSKVLYFAGRWVERILGTIKNQSENVFDLIEVGDLVRYFDNIYEIKKFEIEREIVYMDTQNGICLPSVKRFMELLTAIYKLDEEGNYIKVWEKKDE